MAFDGYTPGTRGVSAFGTLTSDEAVRIGETLGAAQAGAVQAGAAQAGVTSPAGWPLPGAGQTVAVLAVQGAFIEHERCLEQLGARCVELRQARDLDRPFDRLVLPGGESTVQGKLLRELGMFEPLRQRILAGMPVLATCAGLILLADQIADDPVVHFGTLQATVRRNAYGRQLGSFHAVAPFAGLGPDGAPASIPMTFIRAPYVSEVRGDTRVLAEVDGRIVAVRQGNQLGCAFHPELDPDARIHELFLRM